jgi:hypothetical protein
MDVTRKPHVELFTVHLHDELDRILERRAARSRGSSLVSPPRRRPVARADNSMLWERCLAMAFIP